MKTYEKEMQLWKEITKNCPSDDEVFYGTMSGVWKDTYKYVSQAETVAGKFALALCSKDEEAISRLHEETKLTDKEKAKLDRLKKHNAECLSTLNLAILNSKYDFLDKHIDLIALDHKAQERILSLNDKELLLLEKIYNRLLAYEIDPCTTLDKILSVLGKRIIPAWNRQEEYTYQEFINNTNINELTDNELDTLIFLLSIDYYFEVKNIEELRNINNSLKQELLDTIRTTQDIDELKSDFLIVTYGFKLGDAKYLTRMFDFEGTDKYQNDPSYITYSVIKQIVEEQDIEVLRNVCLEFCGMYDFNFIPCRKQILIENLKNIFAQELNSCDIDFQTKEEINEIEGIKLYNAGPEFIVKAKVIGAFSDEGRTKTNNFDDWNSPRYRAHINALSLVSNDNLAFAKGAESSLIIGFNNFHPNMLTTMYHSDNNSVVESRSLGYNVFSNNTYFAFPQNFINKTRNSHNEIDYERQDYQVNAPYFKKNPDYLIFVQEANNLEELPQDIRNTQQELLAKTIKASQEFGNLPVLIINREECAISETNKMNQLLETFTTTKDFSVAKELIIKFGNNRNGTREGHEYIRNKYFSNKIFSDYMDIIVNHLNPDNIKDLIDLLTSEEKAASNNFYDKTFNLPYKLYIEELNAKLNTKGY